MSYLNRTTNPQQRSAAVAGVIAIHALLGYVVLTGLIQHMGPRHRDIFSGTLYPEPPPPPPPTPEQQKPKTVEDKQTAPETKTDLTPDDGQVETTPEDTTLTEIPGDTTHGDPPPPPLPPRFTPRSASPRNSPGSWAMTDDYPARDLHEGNEGTTAFRVTIGANGRVAGCETVRSSGHPGLDAATCKAVTARARFAPATDENGNTVAGTYSSSVRWQIPR